MIPHFIRSAVRRVLDIGGLARAADVARARRAAADIRAAERARANRQAAAFSARLQTLEEKLRGTHERLAVEHAEGNTLRGLLRHYLVRLRRTELELVARAAAERQLTLARLSMAGTAARRRVTPPRAVARAAHLGSISPDYATAVARWRAGDVPANVRHVRLARLHWSIPSTDADRQSQRILTDRELPFADFASVRQLAVGGVMLDVGAHIGVTSIPRLVLGDFSRAYAAEPETDSYRCLVGNVLDNQLEGRLLPDRVAIAGSASAGPIADVPSLSLDEWVERLGLAAGEVHFIRLGLRDWNLDVLLGAARLLQRRHIVWQIEISPSLMAAAGPAMESLSGHIAAHFSHIKELGRYWASQFRAASDVRAVLDALSNERRAANVLLFNLPAAPRRKRPLISLLHATARLPGGWTAAMEAFRARAKHPASVEYILAVDEHESFSLPGDALSGWGGHAVVQKGVTSPVSGYNEAAKAARGDILVQIADDYVPPGWWDEQIRAAVPDVTQELVLDVDNSDGVARLLPFSILTRPYYERYGYIFYPRYHGLFADNEFTEQARRDRVVRSARHIVFEHRHPDRGTAPMDAIYERQKSHLADGKKLFKERKARGFPKWPD